MPPIGNTLTADQLNYLIWRYLQEQGQARAAVNLQRDWRNGQDPETLPFAKSIKPLALVKLVHKGLLYYETEQAIQQKHHGASPIPFFGYDTEPSVSTLNRNGSDDEAATELRISPRSRKHGRENAANGLGLDLPTSAPSAKRIRRSNGTDYTTNGHGMAIDHDGDMKYGQPEHPEPISRSNSPGAEEMGMEIDADGDAPAPDEAPASMTLTNGPSVGVQSDKVAELGPETTVLTLPPGKHVTHTAWNPHDPTLLATAGEALCRIWTITKPSPSTPMGDLDSPSFNHVDMLESFEGSLVSTIEWCPNGELLALATRRGPSVCVGLVSLWTKHGKELDELPATEDMVLTFRWNPSGKLLLGITNSGAGNSTLIIWHAQDPDFRADFRVDAVVRDAAWTSDLDFTICGHRCVRGFRVDDSVIKASYSRPEDEVCYSWSHVRFDMTTRVTALAAEDKGVIALLDSADNYHVTFAHKDEITALAYQPIANPSSYASSSPRILATSALDCSIKLWDAQRPFDLVATLSIAPSIPPVAISFTADGYLVAAASLNRVTIWNPERGNVPLARWKGESDQWQGLATNRMDQDSGIGEEDEIPPHSLSWDASGGKLAYGLRNQVAILNFRSSPSR